MDSASKSTMSRPAPHADLGDELSDSSDPDLIATVRNSTPEKGVPVTRSDSPL